MAQFPTLVIYKHSLRHRMTRTPKPSGRKSSLKRRTNYRELRKRFIIVCEGEKTEPTYFSGFRVPKEIIEIIGTGANTVNLVKHVIKEKALQEDAQVWCVFDKNSFPIQKFNQALEMAKQHNVNVAYSNEAFELWYLLHFDYHDTAISRNSYQTKLTNKLGFRYEKKNPDMYEILEDKQSTAIRNATRLLKVYSNGHRPAYDNPCTTVHLLVETLNQAAV